MSTDLHLLLPVDRYLVEYETGTGVPFSEFDLTIARAVADDGAVDLEKISELLALPQRLVIESLVGLARAGWVAVGARTAVFSVTPLGRKALKDPQVFMPERLHTRSARILMERSTGQVGSGNAVAYHTWRSLQEADEWAKYVVLDSDSGIPRMDTGSVKALLRRDKNEWIRHIGEPLLQQEVWVKLYVENDRIHGLPDAWRSAVTARIAQQLGRPSLHVGVQVTPGRALRKRNAIERTWHGDRNSTTLIFGRQDHSKALARALTEAKSQVLIASAFVSAAVIENDLGPLVIEATRRGVRVDLLWGYSAGEEEIDKRRTIDALADLKRACAGLNLLRYNEAPSGSHAKLLAWNTVDDRVHVCTGSFNWLSVRSEAQGAAPTPREVSVLTSNSGLVGDLCTTVASLWVQADASMLGCSDLWQHTAAHLERRATREQLALRAEDDEPSATDDGPASNLTSEPIGQNFDLDGMELRQVRDQEHESLMREMLLTARTRIGVVSHKIGAKGIVRLSSLPRHSEAVPVSVAVRVAVGELQDDAAPMMGDVEAAIQSVGGVFTVHPGLHAKVVLADDSMLVSSYNFLSADPFATSGNAREVGVLIRNRQLSDQIWAWIESIK
jgi:hypothetical protein